MPEANSSTDTRSGLRFIFAGVILIALTIWVLLTSDRTELSWIIGMTPLGAVFGFLVGAFCIVESGTQRRLRGAERIRAMHFWTIYLAIAFYLSGVLGALAHPG